MANEENRKRDEALWTAAEAATCAASAAEAGRTKPHGAAAAGAASAAETGRTEPDGAAVAKAGQPGPDGDVQPRPDEDIAAEAGQPGPDGAATAGSASAAEAGRTGPHGAATTGAASAAEAGKMEPDGASTSIAGQPGPDGAAATGAASAAEAGRTGPHGAATAKAGQPGSDGAGQPGPDRAATAGGASAAEAGRTEPDGAAAAKAGQPGSDGVVQPGPDEDIAAEAGQPGPDRDAAADGASAAEAGRTESDGAASVKCVERKPAARRGRGRSIRKLGVQMLQTPVEVSEEQREALNRLGVAQDESELQVLLLGRLATFALYGEPRLALQAMDKLLEISGKDIRTLENDENRKIKQAELALNREKFESSARSPEQSSLEKLDALIAGIDSVARATSAPLEESGSMTEDGKPGECGPEDAKGRPPGPD